MAILLGLTRFLTDDRVIPKPLPTGQTLSEWRVGKVNWFVKSPRELVKYGVWAMRRYINFRTWPHSIRSWLPSYGCPTSWATEPVVWKCWSFCVGLTLTFAEAMTAAANLHWNIFGFKSWPQKSSNKWGVWTKYLGRVESYAKRTIQNLVCRFMFFLANIWWRHFSLNLWAVLNLNFRGLFPFSSKCWASGRLVGPRVNYCGMKVTTELLTGESIQRRSSHHVDTFIFQYLSGHYWLGD